MAEIPFEILVGAQETTRGTAATAPTHFLNMQGMIAPRKTRYRPEESRGLLAQSYRSVDAKRWCDVSGQGPLDVYTLPLLLSSVLRGAYVS